MGQLARAKLKVKCKELGVDIEHLKEHVLTELKKEDSFSYHLLVKTYNEKFSVHDADVLCEIYDEVRTARTEKAAWRKSKRVYY